MKILVCGSRTVTDYAYIEEVMNGALDRSIETMDCEPITELVQGNAKGADSLAMQWAQSKGLIVHEHPADWSKYGKRAGYIRNAEMLEKHPDIQFVVAFTDKPLADSRGTAMMIDLSRSAGKTVHHFRTDTRTMEF